MWNEWVTLCHDPQAPWKCVLQRDKAAPFDVLLPTRYTETATCVLERQIRDFLFAEAASSPPVVIASNGLSAADTMPPRCSAYSLPQDRFSPSRLDITFLRSSSRHRRRFAEHVTCCPLEQVQAHLSLTSTLRGRMHGREKDALIIFFLEHLILPAKRATPRFRSPLRGLLRWSWG